MIESLVERLGFARSRVEAAGRLVLLLIGTAYYFLLNLSLFVAHC